MHKYLIKIVQKHCTNKSKKSSNHPSEIYTFSTMFQFELVRNLLIEKFSSLHRIKFMKQKTRGVIKKILKKLRDLN